MNPQKQQKQGQQKRSPIGNPTSSLLGLPLKLILFGVGIIVLLIAVQSLSGRLSKPLNLKSIELNPNADTEKKAQIEAPRYGLDDKTVPQEQVTINLRDNGGEDGDYVTLYANGQALTSSFFITNAGQSINVALNPGPNLIEITADKDGVGGVTLAADVSSQSNMASSAIPVGSKAAFYIIRR